MSRVVLVTGASGFVGSSVVQQLLENGFHVRGTARGQKAADLRNSFTSFKDRFEVIEITDLNKPSPLPDHALKDLWGFVHVALYAPSSPDESLEDILKGYIDSTRNILKQVEKSGAKHFVYTGTMGAVAEYGHPPGTTYKHTDWNPITIEEALKSNELLLVYAAGKKHAELTVWEWADAHPEVEVATIHPPCVLGPWATGFHLSRPSFPAMTPVFWNFIDPEGYFFFEPEYIDVRDLAKAHVWAMTQARLTSEVGRKRLIVASPHGVDYGRSVELLREERPQLRGRLIKRKPPVFEHDRLSIEFDWVEKVLRMRKEDFYTWEETLLDGIDNYVELEKQWTASGHDFKTPPLLPGLVAPEPEGEKKVD
ncbi:hypothetical protein PQX77_015134 [Marasmius sp. AFHP31]|nr:hypothetical protein PQX77_015134 [Marasmius sp. AFHP31]